MSSRFSANLTAASPFHHPDPSKPKNLEDLIKTVKTEDCDYGFALDGDGDRLGVVTKQGEIIFPDRLMMLLPKIF